MLSTMQTFFFDIFGAIPDLLQSEPIIYFVALIFGWTVFALFMKILFSGGRQR